MNKRIQRKRIKGWKMPDNAVYVGRPSKWGNPFRIGYYNNFPILILALIAKDSDEIHELRKGIYVKDKRAAVYWFERLHGVFDKDYFKELRGKDLACWCNINDPCHADILLKLANK